MGFVRFQVVHPYSSTNTITTWKISSFISSERSSFHLSGVKVNKLDCEIGICEFE